MLKKNSHTKFWSSIAIISGIFTFIICFLIIANYFQINRLDPVNTEVINSLIDRLNTNSADEQLENEIRELDLLARKAYFTNRWQIKNGGYLLLIFSSILIIALQVLKYNEKISPILIDENEKTAIKEKARKWILSGGVLIAISALFVSYISYEKLGKKFESEAVSANIEIQTVEIHKPELQVQKIEETFRQKELPKEATKGEKVENVVLKEERENKPVEIEHKRKEISFAEIEKNFPNFRGPKGLGISYHKNIPTNWDGTDGTNILWKAAIPLQGYNSPIVWGKYVFLAGANSLNRQIFCFEVSSGKLLWTYDVKGISGSPAKSPKVTNDTGHSAPTLATDGKMVYAIFANGDVVALNYNGTKIWNKNLGVPDNHYGHSSSLLVCDEKIIVQFDHKKEASIMALSAKSGDIVWSTERDVRVSWASPVLAENNSKIEIILLSEPYLASYDLSTGNELWKIDCMTGEVGPLVAYLDGVVYALNEYASLVAVDITGEPKILWEDYDYLSDVPSPIAYKNYLFVATSYGAVACYDAKTGKKFWEHEFNNGFYSSPILVENKIYLIDILGVTHIFSADKEFKIIAEPKLGEKVVSTPAFANGKIFIRTDKNLYCIGEK